MAGLMFGMQEPAHPYSWQTGLNCLFGNHNHFERLAINVPNATPDPKPKANIPILTAELTSLQITTDETVAKIRNRSATPT